MKQPLVSVVINNYNYAAFIGEAINSALAQTYTNTELIVVDDGSTDNSRHIISSFGSRVTPIFKANGGHGSCFNAGFEQCHGDFVFFLDSDDYYHPLTIETALQEFVDDVVLVQMRMYKVNIDGKIIGTHPQNSSRFDVGDVIPQLTTNGCFVGTVTSGNGFRRSILDQIMPIDEHTFCQAADGYLTHSVPFYGKVAAVNEPIAYYRRHDRNDSNIAVGFMISPDKLRKKVIYAMNELNVLHGNAIKFNRPCARHLAYRNSTAMVNRIASLKVDPSLHPMHTDRAWRLGALSAFYALRGNNVLQPRLFLFVWFLWMGLMPQALCNTMMKLVLAPSSIKGVTFLKRILKAIKMGRSI
jgi:glycosyltransferase involved in cell wall biosynthesis